MSDIFLSYKSEERARAKKFEEALGQQGYSVWWDQELPPGKEWGEFLEDNLKAAKCVIVLWSKESVKSNNVKEEAREGLRRHVLIPVLIDDVMPPYGFKEIQAAKLIGWDGTRQNPQFEILLTSVAEILGRPVVVSKEPVPKAISGWMSPLIKKYLSSLLTILVAAFKNQISPLKELNMTAQQSYNKEKYSEALDTWKEVLKIDPGNRNALKGIKSAENKMRPKKFKKYCPWCGNLNDRTLKFCTHCGAELFGI